MTTKNEGPKAPTDPVAVATGSPQVDSAQDLRKRAEEKARDMGLENLESLSPEETRQALHELRVHQIELEMQNEELRRARAELDAARARYFELYDFSPMGYCTLNDKGLILEANLTAATLLGMARGALVKQPLARLILPEDQDIYYRHRKQLFETGAPQVCVLRILRADADPFWARIEATAAQDADGTSVYRMVMSDITESKRNEEALRLSEQHWRVLFNSANDAVFVHEWNDQSAASPFLEVNDIACARLGYSREELLRMSPADLDAPESVPNAPDVIRTLRESGQAVFEAVHCAKDGRRIPVEISTRRFQLGGRPMVFSIARDISKIKQREQMYKAILTTAADGFWLADREGRLCEVNDAYCVMSGYSRDELLRLRISDIEAAETPQETREHIERIIRQGGADCFETRHRRKDGSFMDLEVTTQFLNVQGGIFVVFLHDVTERKQAEEMLELEAVRLQAQLELHKLMDIPPDQLLDFVLEAITKTIQSQFAFIGLMDQAEAVMTLHAWSKGALAQCAIETRPMHFPISEAGLWGECVRQRQPVIVNAYADAPDKKGYPAGHVPIERFLAVPIFDGERIVAVAAAANKSSDYNESDSIALTILTNRMWDILRRKQAEEALQIALTESVGREHQVSALLQATRAALASSTFEETARRVFDICRQITGATSGYIALLSKDGQNNEVLFLQAGGLPCNVDPSLPMPTRGLRSEAYKSGKVVYDNGFANSEWQRLIPEGHVALHNVMFAPMSHKGKVLGLLGIANKPQDFTERDAALAGALAEVISVALQRSHAEDALRESEARYRVVVQSAQEAIVTTDRAGNIAGWNQGAEHIFGHTESEVINQPLTMLMPSRYHDRHSAGMARVQSGGEQHLIGRTAVELVGLRKDKREFPLELSVARWESAAGWFFTGIIRDITERKQAEMEFRDRTMALETLNQTMMGREARIVELKEEVNRLGAELGKEPSLNAPTGGMSEAASPERAGQPAGEENPPPSAPSAGSPFGPADASAPVGRGSRLRWVAGLVLLVSLSVTVTAWYLARGETKSRAQERFDFRVTSVETALRERFLAYQHLLRGGAGLFAASDEVTRQAWRTYVDNLQIAQFYPGVQGLGFSKQIRPAEKEAHLRRIRAEGFLQYTIRPEGERPEYTAIIFLEPFDWRNQRAFGYDMFSESVRRQAMTQARDTGLPALSGKVTLVQETNEDVQTGFLIYVPVYRRGTAPETPEQRREALEGYVYSPFRMNDFIRGLLEKDPLKIEFRIHDGESAMKETLMYSSGQSGQHAEVDRPHLFTRQSTFEFGGHRWLLTFVSSPQFEAAIDWGGMNAILWLGILTSLLLSGMVLAFDRSYRQTVALANMAADIEKANRKLTAEVVKRERSDETLERQMAEVLAANETMTGRETRVIELKEEVNRLCAELGREPHYPPVWQGAIPWLEGVESSQSREEK